MTVETNLCVLSACRLDEARERLLAVTWAASVGKLTAEAAGDAVVAEVERLEEWCRVMANVAGDWAEGSKELRARAETAEAACEEWEQVTEALRRRSEPVLRMN